jgi:hypothetical protein
MIRYDPSFANMKESEAPMAENANREKRRRAQMCDEFSVRQYGIGFSPADGRLLSSFALRAQSTSFARGGLAPRKLIIG